MVKLLTQWSSINSGSLNLTGIANMRDEVCKAAQHLHANIETVSLPDWEQIDDHGQAIHLPLAPSLILTKRPDAPHQALLVIHLDTVYPLSSPFQQPHLRDPNTLVGPGVADAKGGLVILLTALHAIERSEQCNALGWQVILNTDEELGSPGSSLLLTQAARHHDLGLVFEPTLPDGVFVGARKGSGNFAIVVRGKAAHVGRAFDEGRNAIHLLSEIIVSLADFNRTLPGCIVSVGKVVGGGPVNVVPDTAVCRFNVRVDDMDDANALLAGIDHLVHNMNRRQGYEVTLHGQMSAPPRPLNAKMLGLLQQVRAAGQELGMAIRWRSTGGVCDGNRLAAAGLPVVDTMGPRGGDIHSSNEYVLLDSLTERAKLTTLLLMKLAAGELKLPARQPADEVYK